MRRQTGPLPRRSTLAPTPPSSPPGSPNASQTPPRRQQRQQSTAAPEPDIARLTAEEITAIIDELGDMTAALRQPSQSTSCTSTATSAYG
jgi:hypothetical protein